MSATNVSSNITLFFAVFIPTLWIAFFSIIALAFTLSDVIRFPGFSPTAIKVAFWVFLLLGILFFRFTLMKLKRVEMDSDYLYASNYFKTLRYTYDSVEKVKPIDLGVLTLMKVVLWKKGKWGKNIFFVASRPRLLSAIQQYPKSGKAFGAPSI